MKLRDDVTRFFSLFADEIYYTGQYLRNRRGVLPGAVVQQLYAMGYRSFPIIVLITFLVGVTISLTSAAQLRLFGADVYLADLIAIAMIRELVPLMTGIMLAGKIGASITAEIATMKVMDELDALRTMGIVPEKFLMVPRLIAITLVVPLLVTLADGVGLAGGALIGRLTLNIQPTIFFKQVFLAITFSDVLIGIVKTLVFGWAVVVGSGFKGFFITRGAEEVGTATTDSVVLSISLIIGLDCVFAFLLY